MIVEAGAVGIVFGFVPLDVTDLHIFVQPAANPEQSLWYLPSG